MNHELTTAEAAEAVCIDRVTLQRWIGAGKVKAPKATLRNGRGVRLWKASDVEQLRQVKAKIHRKGRGRKPQAKRKR